MTRHITRFTSFDGTTIDYTFPTGNYELEETQPLRSPKAAAIGLDYAIRLLGDERALKDAASIRIRALFTGDDTAQDAEMDRLKTELYLGARGKLWTSDNRWAIAELVEMPSITVSWEAPPVLPISLGFVRLSDWFSDTPISVSETITTNGQAVLVNNPGNLTAHRVVIRLLAGNLGFDNPRIVNNNTGEEFESLRASTGSDDILKLDTTVPSVQFSDDGVNYVDDFANYVLPGNNQRILTLRLMPGDNTLVLFNADTPEFTFELTADAPFA